MVKKKHGGHNYSIYFKKHQCEFIDEYIDDVSAYFQEKVDEDMADCEAFFKKNIKELEKKLHRQKELLEKAKQNKKDKKIAFEKLRDVYKSRSVDNRRSFLDGATGKKLLMATQLTKKQFENKMLYGD